MKRITLLFGALAVMLTGVVVVRGTFSLAGTRTSDSPATADKGDEQASQPAAAPAERLRIAIGEHRGKVTEVLTEEQPAWDSAPLTRVLMNRTPRVFQTEQKTATAPPILEVRGLRAEGKLYIRLSWADATKDAPTAPTRRKGEAGEPGRLYKQPTGQTSAFADAAAVMVPQQWKGPSFPSLQMGDKQTPVSLYYWSAVKGAEEMTASGRATPASTGKKVRHHARHAEGKWVVIVEIPDRPAGSPVAFAVWDGHNQDRDGRKAFSLWYVLRNASEKGKKP
jgi:hypothetical protein